MHRDCHVEACGVALIAPGKCVPIGRVLQLYARGVVLKPFMQVFGEKWCGQCKMDKWVVQSVAGNDIRKHKLQTARKTINGLEKILHFS